MTQTPPALISIVIPHYGDSSIPSALLDALDHQETDRNLEVILVDDASPEPFEDRAGIRVIRRETNGGSGSAVNTGVDERGNDQHSARRAPRISHLFVEWLIPLARLRTTSYLQRAVGYDLDNSAADRRVDWLVGTALLLPTATFRSVGGFDERFHMNCEEIDLQRRWLLTARRRHAEKWGVSGRCRSHSPSPRS